MSQKPDLSSVDQLPPDVKKLCELVRDVADGLPVLTFLPNESHSRLFPLVVFSDTTSDHAGQVNGYLSGDRLEPPSGLLRQKHDLQLEAIHAATDYLPTIVFLPDKQGLHPVTLVPETVPDELQPCYLTVQHAQQTGIGHLPLAVEAS